ncbi:MAG TPA: heat-shock protein [Alphaproteobacteria bacterium]|nr:heat-shock protein [Alphaproteobacteria bacterium]HAJ46926.1 heat-shock protein [Alphaproteobacteria bacterium]
MPTLVPFSWGTDLAQRRNEDPFSALQNEVNRIFDGFSRLTGGQELTLTAPRLDVAETAEAFEIHAELPGLSEKEVELSIAGDVLTIKGEKQSARDDKTKDYHLTERRYGAFSRSIRLPFTIDTDTAKASFEKGVLTVVIPKPKEQRAKSSRIPISAN